MNDRNKSKRRDKLKTDENLKKALKMSIEQWQMMVDNPGMSKSDAYINLGGKEMNSCCFLCDIVFCIDCLSWDHFRDNIDYYCQCTKSPSSYFDWMICKNPDNTIKVLNYLKRELANREKPDKKSTN